MTTLPWTAVSAGTLLLSSFVTQPQPWLDLQANSEQRQPVYLGATPRELALRLSGRDGGRAVLPESLRGLAERKIRALARKLGESRIEVEAWPAQDDQGKLIWAFARWRKSPSDSWQWVDSKDVYRPWVAKERSQVFDDFLLMDDLYAKPVFGDCIWSSERGMSIDGAWMGLDSLERVKAQSQASRSVCRVLPQPARLEGKPFELVVSYDSGTLSWPGQVSWDSNSPAAPGPARPTDLVRAWPADFEDRYRQDVLTLAGQQEAVFAGSGETVRFVRKSSADPSNQLLELVRYLEERYTSLGVRTRRQSFVWRGIPQANLIAILPGTAPDHAARPVLMADHYDTAFCEDTFAKSGERVSAPGADDNDTAAATLLRAAEILKSLPHASDIWLVHLTGEEFPGDDLGARHLVSQLLSDGQDIGGLVLMDMIGWHKSGDGLFQISAGNSDASLRIAGLALGSALELAPRSMVPVVRTRFDERSYLYNTDGLTFSDAGYPVILLNEHLNYLENLNRAGYHQTTDTSAKVDFGFASAIARVAIQTAYSLSNVTGVPPLFSY